MNFSVIVCTYNCAQFLPDALRTLAAQTVDDFELLIVDDGSTDATKDVVKQWSGQFRNCIYLQKPHTGLADSLNFGVRQSSGTHIALLDADDLWSPVHLESVRRIFETTKEAELVCCDGLKVDSVGSIIGTLIPDALPPLSGRITSAHNLFEFSTHCFTCATIYSKSLYDRVGSYDVRFPIGHDQHWVLRAVLGGAFCVRLDEKLALYRQHSLSLTAKVDEAFECWLGIYQDTLQNTPIEGLQTCARSFNRRWLPALLTRYPPSINRRLLRRAIETIGDDPLLRIGSLLTYFGLCNALRWAFVARRHLRSRQASGFRLDLNAPPEKLFEGIY